MHVLTSVVMAMSGLSGIRQIYSTVKSLLKDTSEMQTGHHCSISI